uniref:Macaca fascicularis brain cDNA clone: QflA-16359, similar to human mannosidase, alpha, class 2A, member 1 (MAN2A1), mRNA, RefSeq: NM_002372.1 n=1 Tax=Macaca fascicularis TaxID=9541 RepID=I7G502_MACFA|nr:unnamed protein product [Macaca fascicularis]
MEPRLKETKVVPTSSYLMVMPSLMFTQHRPLSE